MPILVLSFLLVDIVILAAAGFEHRGYALADQVCRGAFGVCDARFWLAGGAAVLASIYFAMKSA